MWVDTAEPPTSDADSRWPGSTSTFRRRRAGRSGPPAPLTRVVATDYMVSVDTTAAERGGDGEDCPARPDADELGPVPVPQGPRPDCLEHAETWYADRNVHPDWQLYLVTDEFTALIGSRRKATS